MRTESARREARPQLSPPPLGVASFLRGGSLLPVSSLPAAPSNGLLRNDQLAVVPGEPRSQLPGFRGPQLYSPLCPFICGLSQGVRFRLTKVFLGGEGERKSKWSRETGRTAPAPGLFPTRASQASDAPLHKTATKAGPSLWQTREAMSGAAAPGVCAERGEGDVAVISESSLICCYGAGNFTSPRRKQILGTLVSLYLQAFSWRSVNPTRCHPKLC